MCARSSENQPRLHTLTTRKSRDERRLRVSKPNLGSFQFCFIEFVGSVVSRGATLPNANNANSEYRHQRHQDVHTPPSVVNGGSSHRTPSSRCPQFDKRGWLQHVCACTLLCEALCVHMCARVSEHVHDHAKRCSTPTPHATNSCSRKEV